jgi:hypothetical protein
MGSIESAIEVVGAIWQDIERGQGRHLRGYSVSADSGWDCCRTSAIVYQGKATVEPRIACAGG